MISCKNDLFADPFADHLGGLDSAVNRLIIGFTQFG